MPLNNQDVIIHTTTIAYFFGYFKEVILALFGGATAYLFKYYKEREKNDQYVFSTALFSINIILGGFVGYLIGSTIHPDNAYHDFIIGMSGIASYPILTVLESNFTRVITKIGSYYLNKLFGDVDLDLELDKEKERSKIQKREAFELTEEELVALLDKKRGDH
jgi:hypothetical protein